MAFEESNNNGMYMPVAPAYGGYNNGFGGGDWAWIIILLLCGWGNGFGGMGGWGGFGNMALGYDFPWILNGQHQLSDQISDSSRDAMLNDGINGIRDGIAGLSNQLCNCCHDMSAQMANSDMAALNRSFAEQTANMQGFNGVNGGIADLKYTIASEACTTRAANQANTQSILDKLCALELDNARREAEQLRSELMYARGQASQVAQTAQITNDVYDRLKSCPVGTTPVFGNQPIFGCTSYVGGNSCGCGCNGGF